MESFERLIQVLGELYVERGDIKILHLVAQVKRYRRQAENCGMNVSKVDQEIGKLVADVINGLHVESAIRLIESKLSKLVTDRPKHLDLLVKINIPYVGTIGEDRVIVRVKISNESEVPLKAQALKILDEKGVIVEMLLFKETVFAPKSTVEKSLSLKTGTYRFKFTFMPEGEYEILEVEQQEEVKPLAPSKPNVEPSPPNHAPLEGERWLEETIEKVKRFIQKIEKE